MFGRAEKVKLKAVEEVVAHSHRGIHKRIDENRELLELLQERAPDFLEGHHWVEGWLGCQDGFLNDLLSEFPVLNYEIAPNYPRPWPGKNRAEQAITNTDWVKHGYMYDEHHYGSVPTSENAKKILADYDAGRVILAPICEPGAINRLKTIAAGGEVDPVFFPKR